MQAIPSAALTSSYPLRADSRRPTRVPGRRGRSRDGNRPFLPKIPYVSGYAVVGVVDTVGAAVTMVAPGDQVAALTGTGGYAEYVYLKENLLVEVPSALESAEVAPLILNDLVAYQTLHRTARVSAEGKFFVIGASGGVGTAFLDLRRLAGLTDYGLASKGKHDCLTAMDAIRIDYHTQDFVTVLQRAEPQGIDFVFNGMGEEYLQRGLSVLRRGRALIHYGGPRSFRRFLVLVAELIYFYLLRNGKVIKGYGTHQVDIRQLKEKWTTLFQLLAEGKIHPVIAQTFPLLEATRAHTLLECGQVTGAIVLLVPDPASARAGWRPPER